MYIGPLFSFHVNFGEGVLSRGTSYMALSPFCINQCLLFALPGLATNHADDRRYLHCGLEQSSAHDSMVAVFVLNLAPLEAKPSDALFVHMG